VRIRVRVRVRVRVSGQGQGRVRVRVRAKVWGRVSAPPSSSEGSSGRSRAAAVSSPHSRIILKTSAVGTWVHTVAVWMPTVAASRLG